MPEVNPFVAESERGCGRGYPRAAGGHGQATVVPQPVEMHLSILTVGIVVMLRMPAESQLCIYIHTRNKVP